MHADRPGRAIVPTVIQLFDQARNVWYKNHAHHPHLTLLFSPMGRVDLLMEQESMYWVQTGHIPSNCPEGTFATLCWFPCVLAPEQEEPLIIQIGNRECATNAIWS